MKAGHFKALPIAVAIAAMLGLAACDKQQENRSAGQNVDAAIAKVEQKSDAAAAEVKKDVASARAAVGDAVDATANKVRDAAITTSIKAELARDAALSALKINVDTEGGKVVLRGTAPSAAARDQATQLAQRVDGVAGVENQLKIGSN